MKKGFTLIELLIVIGILAILATTVVLVLNPGEMFRRARDGQRISDLRSVRDAINLYLIRGTAPLDLNVTDPTASRCRINDTVFPQWQASIPNTSPTLPLMTSVQQSFVNPTTPTTAPYQPNTTNLRKVDGTGWVPVDFSSMGSIPLPKLPVDPINQDSTNLSPLGVLTVYPAVAAPSYFYAYQCVGLTYEIMANMESSKYGTDNDTFAPSYIPDPESVENKDGGTKARFGPANCVDPTSTCGGQPVLSNTFFADQVYQVGNAPGLDL